MIEVSGVYSETTEEGQLSHLGEDVDGDVCTVS